MYMDKDLMVPLGYGKYCRADSIVGLEPIEEGRGPGQRTKVIVEHLSTPMIASRSTEAIVRAMVHLEQAGERTHERDQLLGEILQAITDINPLLRSFIRDQGKWDLDRLEERIRDVVRHDQP
jgi:hypothetical protein